MYMYMDRNHFHKDKKYKEPEAFLSVAAASSAEMIPH